MICAASIDCLRSSDVSAIDLHSLYLTSSIHKTEIGEIIDILFGGSYPIIWGTPLGGEYQKVATFIVWVLTYGLALGLIHAGAVLCVRELGQTRDKIWRVSALLLGVVAGLLALFSHLHFVTEFPELRYKSLVIIIWGLGLSLLLVFIVDRLRRKQHEERKRVRVQPTNLAVSNFRPDSDHIGNT